MLQEYLDQLFDAFKEGICISDVEGTVVHLNRRHAEITGIPREEMLGHSVMEFVKRGRLDVVLNPEVMRTGQPATRVQTVSDGRKLILEANPVFDAQGKLVLCITFLRDVTMLSEMREQMSVQKELLEAFQQLSTAGDAQELSRKTPKLFTSSAMIKLYGEVNTIAETDATVLLLGETGVGKDVIARRIHALSLRKNKTFIKVDCGSIPENLIETELFGYAAGTFSGASKTGKIGLIEAAAGGTLFLDEIGELPMPMQTRLLRFLQDWEIMRVGSTTPKQIDVRIVAATNRDLKKEVAQGSFRRDLYYRLNVIPVHIPPLRERKEDLPLLVDNFIHRLNYQLGMVIEGVAPGAMDLLMDYDWPGNVRELRALVQSLATMSEEETITMQDLPQYMQAQSPLPQGSVSFRQPMREAVAELERNMIMTALTETGSTYKAARRLKVSQSTIVRKAQRYKIGLVEIAHK